MKWAKARGHCRDYYAWRAIGLTMLVTAIIAVAIVLLIALLVLCLAPRNATAGDIVNFRTARRLAPVTLHSDVPVSRDSVPIAELYMEISAYSPTVQECDAAPLVTASGQRVRVGGIAADLRILPLGSIVTIPNYNGGKPCTVIDTGSYIKGNRLDVFLWKTEEAIHWGRRRNVKVLVLYVPKETL